MSNDEAGYTYTVWVSNSDGMFFSIATVHNVDSIHFEGHRVDFYSIDGGIVCSVNGWRKVELVE